MKIGNIIKTSYHTGPYIIIDMHEVEDGSISLILNAAPPNNKEAGKSKFWINGIRFKNGRWMSYGDEIYIIEDGPTRPVQLRLF